MFHAPHRLFGAERYQVKVLASRESVLDVDYNPDSRVGCNMLHPVQNVIFVHSCFHFFGCFWSLVFRF